MKEQECHCCKEWKPESEMNRYVDPYTLAMFGAYDYIWCCKNEVCEKDTQNHLTILTEDI